MNDLDQLIARYSISDEAINVIRTTPIMLLVGITAAGKDTIQNKLLASGEYYPIVTHTTRARRMNNGIMERDGQHYHFVTTDVIQQMLERQEFIEVNRFGDNYYGTSVGEFIAAKQNGKVALGDIDVHGIASFRAISKDNIIPIFIVPPDYSTWRHRLDRRYQSKDELERELPKRLLAARQELEHALSVPYYHFIINDDLERAVRVVDEIAQSTNTFNRHDTEARVRATHLLEAIQANL